MPYKEREIQKMFYTIGEVAKMFDVNTSHIRFWSKQFDVIKPATNKKGNRLFTSGDIENFKVIYHLVKEKGFTLKGARIELQSLKKKMKIESKPEVDLSEMQSEKGNMTVPEMTVVQPADDLVEKMALKNSLMKIRATLVQLSGELETIRS